MATQADIICLPHPSLRQRSKRVHIITDDTLSLVQDMSEALLDWEAHREHEVGVALAAVQINKLDRVVIVRNDFDNKEDRSFLTLINPVIIKKEGNLIEDFEGCLSISNVYGKVPRNEKVKIKAIDLDGREFRMTAEGFLARILQHEIDHTNGIAFVDHIKDKPDAFFSLKKDGNLEPLDFNMHIKNSNLWD